MDAELFIRCAEMMQRDKDNDLDANTIARAEMLVDSLVEDVEEMIPQGASQHVLINKIKSLHFVPREHPVLRTWRLFSFADCCIPREAHLVPYSMPALKQKWVPPTESFSLLSIVSPPSTEKILASLRNATEKLLQAYPLPKNSPTADFCTTLDVLGQRAKNQNWLASLLPDGVKKCLQEHACLPINDTTLALPMRCFFHVERQIPPLMYQLPDAYKEHKDALMQFGVQETPSPQFFKDTLHSLRRETPMTPGELNGALALIEMMGTREIKVHCIPDADSVMRDCQDMLYNDAPWLLPRLKADQISFSHPRLSRAVCKDLGLNTLQRVVQEKLNAVPEAVAPADSETYTTRLHSKEFLDCTVSLLQHLSDAPQAQVVGATLKKYRVELVNKLDTRLTIGDDDMTKQDGVCLFYADEVDHVVYIARLPSFVKSVSTAIARCVVKVLKLPQIPPFLPELLDCEPSDMPGCIQTLQLTGEAEGIGATRGKLGAQLIPTDRDNVTSNVKRQHVVGECIAWQDERGIKRYGEVAGVTETSLEDAPYEFLIRVGGVTKKTVSCALVFTFDNAAAHSDTVQEAPEWQDVEEEDEAEGANRILSTMMQQMGIPLDGDQEQLMNTLEASRRQVLQLEKKAEDMEKNLERLKRENDDLQKQVQCSICLEGRVDRVLLPCGHVLCGACEPQVQHCPTCRSHKTSAIDLFL